MGQWRGTYLDTGPPRGPGHYSQDGRWWWDDHHQQWFRLTDQEDVLEIEAEDVGAQGAWLETQRERLQELHHQLLAEGWRPAGHGAHWWSAIYRRPDIDWDTTPDAYERMQRSA
jgi:hypothetical protein